MFTEAEKKELEALRAKEKLTTEETARLKALEALEAKAKTKDDKTYSEDYVKSLRDEAAKWRTGLREAETKLAKLDNVDPEKYAQLLKAQEDAEKTKLEKAGEFDKLRDKLVKNHETALALKESESKAKDDKIKALEKELNDTILKNEISIQAAIAKAHNPRLVEMVAMQMARIETTEDGRKVVKIVEEDGSTAKIDLATGKPMTISQLLDEMKQSESYAHLFAGGNTGAGSGTLKFKGKSVANPWKKETFNLTLQGEITKTDPDLAARLKAEAGK